MGEEGSGFADDDQGLAPVIPLFGARGATAAAPAADRGFSRSYGAGADVTSLAAPAQDDTAADRADVSDTAVDAADETLVRRLRARQLSVGEARLFLRSQTLSSDEIEIVIDRHLQRGYLDDVRLVEQLVYAAVERRGQGRALIAQQLARRGIERDVIDAAIAELPDDDVERALEFARQKARSMRSLDRDTALRRLHGQLARRGFGGSLAMSVASRALDDEGIGQSRVRFR